jgi:ActR/RegA family two-component response regulator
MPDETGKGAAVAILDPSFMGGRMVQALLQIDMVPLLVGSVEALHQHCRLRPPAGIVLDFDAVDGDPLDLIAALRAAHPQARLVVLSRRASTSRATAVLRTGADDFIVKPVAPLLVIDALGIPMSEARLAMLSPELRSLSLEQIKGVFIEDMLVETGSISAAARELGIDRRSFRRMVQRIQAPAHRPASRIPNS